MNLIKEAMKKEDESLEFEWTPLDKIGRLSDGIYWGRSMQYSPATYVDSLGSYTLKNGEWLYDTPDHLMTLHNKPVRLLGYDD